MNGRTRTLLICGILAGPLYVVVGLIEIAIPFSALIAACCVFARRFASERRSGWAAYSVATGIFFFAAFVGNAVGAGSPSLAVAFAIAIVLGWTWISAVAARLAGGLVSAEA